MTPQERLALALQYQKQRDLGSTLPSTPAENAARPVQEPEQSWLDKLSEAASGFGYRKAQDLEGLAQAARHPLDTLHSLAVGVGKAMDNPSAAAQAAWQGLKQSASEAVSNPYNLGSAVAGMTSFNPRKLAAMLESPAVRELTVYHGTPHRFPATEANPLGEFDASKIGTGEGAQVYGHGIYLAESPDVAESYKQMPPQILPVGKYAPNEESAYYAARVVRQMGSPEKAIEKLAGTGKSQEFVQAIKDGSYKKFYDQLPQASLYHADLPDEMIDRMLDWDKPLSEQNPQVQSIVQKYWKDKNLTKMYGDPVEEGFTGETIHNFISKHLEPNFSDKFKNKEIGQESAAMLLNHYGIPGIKYLDAGSRDITNIGTGTRNFVVFPGEEKKVKILERK